MSDEFRRVSAKLLTFSGAAFILKIVPIEAVVISGATVKIDDISIVVGFLCSFIAYLLILFIITWLKDVQRQKNLDLQEFADAQSTGDGMPSLAAPETDHSRGAASYLLLAKAQIVFETMLPAIFAIVVVLFCRNDLLTFWEHVWTVVDSE